MLAVAVVLVVVELHLAALAVVEQVHIVVLVQRPVA
jgi:hypothetical protein